MINHLIHWFKVRILNKNMWCQMSKTFFPSFLQKLGKIFLSNLAVKFDFVLKQIEHLIKMMQGV